MIGQLKSNCSSNNVTSVGLFQDYSAQVAVAFMSVLHEIELN